MIGCLLLTFAAYLFFSYRFLRSSQDLMAVGLLSYPVKIIYSLVILYFVIEFWDYGDLPTYFDLAVEISRGEVGISDFLWGSYLVAVFNSILIFVFGESLVILALLTALTSYIYFLLIFDSVSRVLNKRSWFVLVFLIFIPGIGMQASYVGKEIYILPLIGLLFYFFSMLKLNYLLITAVVILISVIRPYQGIILGASIFSVFFILGNAKSKLAWTFLFLSFFGLFSVTIGTGFIRDLESVVSNGFAAFMENSYGTGNTGLADLPFPLGFFQVFRPFPYEAHNILALFKSFENIIFICLFFYFLFNAMFVVNVLRGDSSRAFKRFFIFVLSYFLINYILFSFSQNIGDISRRQVYFMPQLFLLSYIIYSIKRVKREDIARI